MKKQRRKAVEFVDLTEEVLRKIGEIVDSDGYLSVSKIIGGYKYSLRIRTKDEDKRDFVMHHLGGYPSVQEKGNEVFYWLNMNQFRCIEALKVLYNFIPKNRKQARLVFDLIDLIKKNHFRKLSDEAKAERENLMKEVKALNKARFEDSSNSPTLLTGQESSDGS
jgi:hypothetical protein